MVAKQIITRAKNIVSQVTPDTKEASCKWLELAMEKAKREGNYILASSMLYGTNQIEMKMKKCVTA